MLYFTKTLIILIILAILSNMVGMLFPGLNSTFIPWYGSIAKHIAVTNDWINLVYNGVDWLDKPHLPFWLIASSFKIFGINTFAYILPGFIFHLLGAYYTYKLAKFWYNKEVGLLSALFYLTTFHLMLSSIDVRAEAFLLGQIIPACYYWLCFDRDNKLKYLLLGAFFTALALMTKGMFVLITIISGLACLWIYQKRWQNFISIKWLFALALSIILIFPELISLYLQFDIHPEKIVFDHNHISGIKWFFWDSQFGRFFNTGPIKGSGETSLWHYLFFVHTFLWAFLPWAPIFFVALWKILTNYFKKNIPASDIYLLGSFFITFIIFSITSFQVDHYTNIIFPFASIISAKWFIDNCFKQSDILLSKTLSKIAIFYIESLIAIVLILLVITLNFIVLSGIWFIFINSLAFIALIILFYLHKQPYYLKTIIFPAIAICITFIFFTITNGIEFAKYDAGYQIAKSINQKEALSIVAYQIDLTSLDFYSKPPFILENDLAKIKLFKRPFYLVTFAKYETLIKDNFALSSLIGKSSGTRIETYVANANDKKALTEHLDRYIIMKIEEK